MAKTGAERQREFRKRQKEKGSKFLEEERERVKKYYVPAAEMNKRKLAERNRRNMLRNRLSRLRKKEREANAAEMAADTSGYSSMQVDDDDMQNNLPLIVRLPSLVKSSEQKAKGLKKTHKRALSRARKSIKSLENEVVALRKKIRARNKQIERLRKKTSTKDNNANTAEETTSTPSKQLGTILSTLTPKRKRTIKRRLELGSALLEEIRDSRKELSRKARGGLHNIVAGKITKKYRLFSTISKKTGLSRNSLRKYTTNARIGKEVHRSLTKQIRDTVLTFLRREDNCRVQPGKADAKKDDNGEKQQTVVLTDYLKNLHLKFLSEHPEIKLSLASFCRIRPRSILLASFIVRSACLCQRHQNMALKASCLRNYGINVSRNPDLLLTDTINLDTALTNLPDEVAYKIWKKVPIDMPDGRKILKMDVVEEKKSKQAFKEIFEKELDEFAGHVDRVKTQYQELRKLKDNLPEHEMILQMDFAENFTCRSMNEVQTAYWNKTSVTLHPTVVYYKEGDVLKHKSIVVLSDEINHAANTVCAFLDALIPQLREIDPNVTKVHYWTDSPTSQYRNRFIFYFIATHAQKYGLNAQWNYFEAGHGKGPCDGLGGTTKRMADEAVVQEKAVIQDAKQFFEWAKSSSLKEVRFLFVDKNACDEKKEEFNKICIKPIKNTMKTHAVIGISENSVFTRPTSCYCDQCLKGAYCDGWSMSTLVAKAQNGLQTLGSSAENSLRSEGTDGVVRVESEEETNRSQASEKLQDDSSTNAGGSGSSTTDVSLETSGDTYVTNNITTELCEDHIKNSQIGDFVACVYQNDWFIGEITDIDSEEHDIEVNFMEKRKALYRWPQREDKIWVHSSEFLCTIQAPSPCGKTKRNYRINESDEKLIKEAFDKQSA